MSEADAEDGLFSHGHSSYDRMKEAQLCISVFSPEFPQNKKRGKWKIPPQTPPFPFATSEVKNKSAEVLANPFPKNSFAKTSSALFRHLPEYLEGRTPKKNVLSIFKKNFTPAKSKKQETFFFGVAEALRGSGGTIRAYDSVSRRHARGACDIICFGNRFELGTINTPIQNSTVFWKLKYGTREARPKDSRRIPPTNSEFLARWRALIFRQGGGSKSEAILTHSICFDTKRIFAILNLPPPKIAYFNDHLWFQFEQS